VSAVARRPFPLVPRWRVAGIPFGEQRSVRRGPGSDVAGSRSYRPGDPIGSIDWRASARRSAARGADEFVVRQYYAQEAPRVVAFCDRRPSMRLYPPPFPWLSKPLAAAAVVDAVAVSALAARGELGYLDLADEGMPYWLPPRSRGRRDQLAGRVAEDAFAGPADSLARGLGYLAHQRADLPSGSFVFVVSDFLDPPPAECWLRVLSLRWDVVPVVVQDPLWEQSFPELRSVVVPFAEPGSADVSLVRLSAADSRELRRVHEERRRDLLAAFHRLGIDPVVVGTEDAGEIERAFLTWAEQRRQARRRGR
jgi:uncharacterized protein (DUF58 family)